MIRDFTIGQEQEISRLIRTVFDEFVGHEYTAEGNNVFYDFIKPANIVDRYNKGNIILTYQDQGRIVGMIEVRDNNHICLFFIEKEFQNRGIGKKLFDAVIGKIKNKTDFLEVNASPFSEKIYSNLGFSKISGLTEKNGIKYIPMKMLLEKDSRGLSVHSLPSG